MGTRLSVMGAVAMLFAFSTPTYSADVDWYDFDKESALTKLRNTIEKDGLILPISSKFKCGDPNILRYCTTRISPEVTLTISETAKGQSPTDWEDYNSGKRVGVYEVMATAEASDFETTSKFGSLCSAIMQTFYKSQPQKRALELFVTHLKRAANRSADGFGQSVVLGKPAFVVDMTKGSNATCRASMSLDYRKE